MDCWPLPLDGLLLLPLGLLSLPVRLCRQMFHESLVQLPSVSLGDIGMIEGHHLSKTLPEEVVVVVVKGQLVDSLLQV